MSHASKFRASMRSMGLALGLVALICNVCGFYTGQPRLLFVISNSLPSRNRSPAAGSLRWHKNVPKPTSYCESDGRHGSLRIASSGVAAAMTFWMCSKRVSHMKSRISLAASGGNKPLAPMPLPYGDVALDYCMMAYRQLVPRLYNWCKELGMTPGKILPSIGFCADENQGYPTILIMKHFQAYPFTHGYIGGILALDRHGPHAGHGKDVLIIHAPHVGYDPDLRRYGVYRRKQVEPPVLSTCCGKVDATLSTYKKEYRDTLRRIRVKVEGDSVLVGLSNTIIKESGNDGLFLDFQRLLADGLKDPHLLQSTSKVFVASERFGSMVKAALEAESEEKKKEARDGTEKKTEEKKEKESELDTLPGAKERKLWRSLREPRLRTLLDPSMFFFRRPDLSGEENRLERILLPYMPKILFGPYDSDLAAALIITQSEFDRACHDVSSAVPYKGKIFILLSGLNIDISPEATGAASFPSTMYLPWAAYVHLSDGRRRVLEQPELVEALFSQSDMNPDAIDIEGSLTDLFTRKRKRVTFFDRNTMKNRAAKIL